MNEITDLKGISSTDLLQWKLARQTCTCAWVCEEAWLHYYSHDWARLGALFAVCVCMLEGGMPVGVLASA